MVSTKNPPLRRMLGFVLGLLMMPHLIIASPWRSLPTLPSAVLRRGNRLPLAVARRGERHPLVSRFVEGAMACRDVTGLSVSVVRSERVVMLEGFGVRDEGTREEVDPQTTQFCVGELTMAFTSTLLGILLHEHRREFDGGFDTRLLDIMGPTFRLSDDLRTGHATLRDVLAHRMGYPTYERASLVGLDPSHGRQDYCSRLGLLEAKPDTAFRASFSPNKFMYLLAACAAEKIGGLPYEQLLQDKILTPLGMHRTELVSQMRNLGNVAASYIYNDTANENQEMDPLILRAVGVTDSSLGVCTTASDMSRWMRFQLNKGRIGNMPSTLPAHVWDEIHRASMLLPDSDLPVVKPMFPESDLETGYGLGWNLGSYRGYRYSLHRGSIAGFESLITVYHDIDLAIFTSINGPKFGGMANEVIQYYIADVFMGFQPWLTEVTSCSFPEIGGGTMPLDGNTASSRFLLRAQQASSSKRKKGRKRISIKKTRKSRSTGLDITNFSSHEGTYGHLLFGNLTVYYEGVIGQLRIRMGEIGTGWLQRINDLFWLAHLDGPLEYYSTLGPGKGLFLPLRFAGYENNQYHDVILLGFNAQAPPTYKRKQKWNNLQTHLETAEGRQDDYFDW